MKEDSNWRKAQRDSKESILTVRRHFKTSWKINNWSWSYHGAVLRKSSPLCQLHKFSTPERIETNLESTISRYVPPYSLEQHFLGLSTCWMVTGRNDRLQFTCQQHHSTLSGFYDSFSGPFSLSWCGVSGSWLHTTSKCRTTICCKICKTTIWFLFSYGSVEDLKVLSGDVWNTEDNTAVRHSEI